jgi:Protein of unknown function (DUF3800)
MWFLYLDESGDLGFDFVHKKPSNFFNVTVLLVKGVENNRALINGVKNTLKRKLNPRNKRRRIVAELKGQKTSIQIKEYFYKQVNTIPFELYGVTLSKRRSFDEIIMEKHRLYNYIARLALEQVPIDEARNQVDLIIDKSKNKLQIQEFNSSLINHLQGRIDPSLPLNIYHRTSDQEYGLQAADMFSWGIFRKHERADMEWSEVFKEKICCDMDYP